MRTNQNGSASAAVQVLDFVKSQIYFPKNSLNSLGFRYGTAVFLAIVPAIIESVNHNPTHITIVCLLLFLAVALSAWVGGFGPSLATNAIGATFLYVLFSPPATIDIPTISVIGTYVLISILVSLIIAAAKRAELVSQFNRLETNYVRTIKNLENKNDSLKQEIKARDEFLSIASHELKTPLTATILKLQMILHNVKSVSLANFSVKKLMDMLEGAEQQSERLARMINDILHVSFVGSKKINLELEKADLAAIAKEVVRTMTETAAKAKSHIKLESDKNIRGRFDTLRIEQVVTNLLSNAIKYGAGKTIEVKVKKHRSSARIEITDHGIGIPKNRRDKIFELFQRAVDGPHYEGLGVGLFITNQIVRAHKGQISVKSREGHGSTFTVELPLQN
ncbi:HAMP domain-containing histidine kinase [Candidatus Curtissbacteria bacterium]|nr:HAMP domain-containing histidine kinase [Candidatus Curtissbacteria bacterium]